MDIDHRGRTPPPEVATSDDSMRSHSFSNGRRLNQPNITRPTTFIRNPYAFNLGPTSSSAGATRGIKDVFDFALQNSDNTIYPSQELHPYSLDHFHQDVDANVTYQIQNKNLAIHQSLRERSTGTLIRNTIDNDSNPKLFPQPTDPRLRQNRMDNISNQYCEGNQIDLSDSLSMPINQTNTSSQFQQSSEKSYGGNNTNAFSSSIEHSSMDSHNPWNIQEVSSKVETVSDSGTRSTAERKEHDDDAQSAASTATATTASPSLQPFHSDTADPDQSISGSRFPPSFTFGTPSTVSSSADEVSVDGIIDQQALENLTLKMDDEINNITTVIQRRPALINTPSQKAQGIYPGLISPNAQHSQWNQRPSALMPTPTPIPSVHCDAWGRETVGVSTYNDQQSMFDTNNTYNYSTLRHPRHYGDQYSYSHFPVTAQYHLTKRPGPPQTPPRGGNRPSRAGQRQLGPSQPVNNILSGSVNAPRSSSEVLKTLLRKKACLYEPDTSRAVALVTWLVGRELALEYGYFSRQQLQSGVHACVANKINSGTITRTKVNRCMQIILNSCFHYIIPRPDGSEENGDAFRNHFAARSQDDRLLLESLPEPWSDVTVERSIITQASRPEEEEKKHMSPQASPRLLSAGNPSGSTNEVDSKRAVLLCFNENVRSAVDVFRCHNEFIRDTANASKLQLTANEWRSFFGRDFGISPVWSNVGLGRSDDQDFLGQMNEADLATFRTSWCAKRYDHDHSLCGFSHLEVGGGWLRRNPMHYNYGTKMCKNILRVTVRSIGAIKFVINQCSKGDLCGDAHSDEEILYHPSNYKKNICKASSQSHGCSLGDVCPNLHPHYSQHHIKKPIGDYRSQNRHLNSRHNPNNVQGRGIAGIPPNGAPMLYVDPAPFSMFEKQLQMPGLQNLFRRHSSVLRAHLMSPTPKCTYKNFGNDWGIKEIACENNKSQAVPEINILKSTQNS